MYTIGFATTFYTLWDVSTYTKWGTDRRTGKPYSYLETSHQYLRNLSLDLEAAKEKLKAVIGDEAFNVDLNLRGLSFFVTTGEMKPEKEVPKDYTFTFGQLKGRDIRIAGEWITESRTTYNALALQQPEYYTEEMARRRDAEDRRFWKDIVWHLERAMKQESTMRRKVYARRRLIELGQLVRRNWIEKYPIMDTSADANAPLKYGEIKRKWMPKNLAKWHDEIGSKKGLFFDQGKRVQLDLIEKKRKMIDTQFGIMYIITYADQEGRIFTYKGNTPPKTSDSESILLTATIKHKNNETFFQRPKIISK